MQVETDYPKSPKKETPQLVSLYKVPTELVELPSKGLVYSKNHPLSSGQVEMKYMTAKEEDILTTESFIADGSVLDRFLQSLIVTENVNIDDMVLGDINALTIAARVHGYGPTYEVKVTTPSGKTQVEAIDLTKIPLTYINESLITDTPNEFEFELPGSKHKIIFKLLTQGDSKKLEEQLSKSKLEKEKSPIFKNSSDKSSSTQLRYQIVSVDGHRESNVIQDYIENAMLAYDIKSLRDYIKSMSPGVDLSVEVADREAQNTFLTDITIGPQYFWPDAAI